MVTPKRLGKNNLSSRCSLRQAQSFVILFVANFEASRRMPQILYNSPPTADQPGKLINTVKLLLIMPTKYIGNMVIAMKAIAAILDKYDSGQTVLVLDSQFSGLAPLAFGDQRRFLFYPRQALRHGPLYNRALRYLSFIRQLRAERFDKVVDVDGTVVSARLSWLSRGKQKIGPSFSKRRKPYSTLVDIAQDQHSLGDFAAMAKYLGVNIAEPGYLKLAKDGTLAAVAAKLDTPVDYLNKKPIVCIHPGATKDYKLWDIHKFAELADWLLEKGWNVIVIGAGSSEKERIDTMLATMAGHPINAHDRLSLLELTILFQHAGVFIGNDSGPMHLAVATAPNVIALFGPTEKHRWAPTDEHVQVVQGDFACSPGCHPEACLNNYQCLKSLSVEQVKRAVLSVIQQSVTTSNSHKH